MPDRHILAGKTIKKVYNIDQGKTVIVFKDNSAITITGGCCSGEPFLDIVLEEV